MVFVDRCELSLLGGGVQKTRVAYTSYTHCALTLIITVSRKKQDEAGSYRIAQQNKAIGGVMMWNKMIFCDIAVRSKMAF